MRTQTIHSNALGDVLNETSATGFRITDDQGRTAEVRIEGGIAVIRTPKGRLISLGVYDNSHITGRQPTAVIVDEIVPAPNHKLTCYNCNQDVSWLAPDSRCKDCTRMTPDEVCGS